MKSRGKETALLLILGLMGFSTAAVQQPDDASITTWVSDALSEDARIASPEITVTTVNGIVTLTGNISNLVEKQYAELEVKKIKGVLGVVNALKVETPHRPDIDIKQAIRRRIMNSSVISSQSVAVDVNNGIVTLSGTVPSYSEKQEASLLAGEAKGVLSVDNTISVVYTAKRPDPQIVADVRAKLSRDVYLAGMPIGVLVENGITTLSGTVGNSYEKDRATRDAMQVLNVSDVKNNLRVAWWEITGVRTKPPTPSDSDLAKSVEDELFIDLRIATSRTVRVKAKGGHVTLQGTLPGMRQKLLAQQDALEVVGVAWVSNLITVKAPWRDDLGLYEDAKFALNSDYALSGDDITMYVNSGTVALLGNVNTYYEKSQAEKDVSGTLGVQNIVDNITVSWQPRDIDNAIKGRVEQRLARNGETWQLPGKITLTVREGIVTLAGQVDTWSQLTEAGQIAYQTVGVRLVDNRLSVKGASYEWEKFHTSAPDVLTTPATSDQWRYYPYYH